MRRGDLHECSQLNEMKVDTSVMNMIAGWKSNGDIVMVEQMPILGGYCGGVEETTICDIASTLASFVLLGCDIHLDGPIHIRWGTTTARETLQIAAHAAAAIDQNTDLLIGNQYYVMAGPCTEMCLLETAAQAITDTASGREIVSGVASSKGVVRDRTTGMEARMLGHACKAVSGMEVEEVNDILDELIPIYSKQFSKPPMGKKFQECYDLRNITPTEEYLKIYDKASDTLAELGLHV